jgi:ABC-2 type transport system ATP-binding protein
VAIIDAGKIIAMGSPSALKADIPGNDIVSLLVGNLSPELVRAIGELPFVHKAIAEENSLRVYVDNGSKNLPVLIDDVRQAGGTILSASVHEQSLEDVFIHHTGKSIREEEVKKVSFLVGAGVPQRFGR